MKFVISRISGREPEQTIKYAVYEKIMVHHTIGPRSINKKTGLYLMQEHKRRRFTKPISGTLKEHGVNGYGEMLYEADFECYEWVVEVNTLEELLELQKNCGHSLIIGENYGVRTLDILDDYMC